MIIEKTIPHTNSSSSNNYSLPQPALPALPEVIFELIIHCHILELMVFHITAESKFPYVFVIVALKPHHFLYLCNS